MAVPKVITGTLVGPDNLPRAGAVVAATISQPCLIPGTLEVLQTTVLAFTAADGTYSFSLYSNSDLTPTGTYYSMSASTAGAFAGETIQVPNVALPNGHDGTALHPYVVSELTTGFPPPSANPSAGHVSTLTVDSTAIFNGLANFNADVAIVGNGSGAAVLGLTPHPTNAGGAQGLRVLAAVVADPMTSEYHHLEVDGGTVTYVPVGGVIDNHRHNWLRAPTIASTVPGTIITRAATLELEGPPIAGNNAAYNTFQRNAYALKILKGGATISGGGVTDQSDSNAALSVAGGYVVLRAQTVSDVAEGHIRVYAGTGPLMQQAAKAAWRDDFDGQGNPIALPLGADIVNWDDMSFYWPNFTAVGGPWTLTDPSTLVLVGPPQSTDGSVTIVRPWVLKVNGGDSRFGGRIVLTPAASKLVMGANSFALRDITDSFNQFLVSPVGSFTFRADIRRSRQTLNETGASSLTTGLDPTLGDGMKVTLTAARLVAAPLNPALGQDIRITFIQGNGGGWAVTWDPVFKIAWSDAGNTVNKQSTVLLGYNGVNWVQLAGQSPYV